MNSYLENIKSLLQQTSLSAEQIQALQKALADAGKQWAITEFKLDRTEKVKKTTAILLEETIAELEQKRNTVETKNRELEIEAALERVRTVAMSMKSREDMLEVCKIISEQLTSLGVKEIRNVQTAIFYEGKGTYMNYEFYAKHRKAIVTETTYNNHKIHRAFAEQMLKGNGEFFSTHIAASELEDWIAYQKTTNVFIDEFLTTASSLNYYWHSLGSVALGMSTYQPLSEDDLRLFNRFLKVFELAYRRYQNIETAEAQAREAQIQLALERVRARTMAMQKSDELPETSLILFQQLKELGEPAEQLSIGIMNEAENVVEISATLDGKKFQQTFRHNVDEPFVMNKIIAAWKAQQKSLTIEQSTEELEAYNKFRNELTGDQRFPTKLPPGERRILYVAFFSKGMLGLSTNKPRPKESLELLERFASVFDLTYTRFSDLKLAEAQAREAQIEAALERVRSRSMAMHQTSELQDVIHTVHKELMNLDLSIDGGSFVTINEDVGPELKCWGAGGTANTSEEILVPGFDLPFVTNLVNGIKRRHEFFTEEFSQEEKKEYFTKLFEHAPWSDLSDEYKKQTLSSPGGYTRSVVVSKHTSIFIINHTGRKFTDFENDIVKRFAKVFEQSYTRFLDLKKAETRAREAQIETALERVRSRTMAMHQSKEIADIGGKIFSELRQLDLVLNRVLIWIFNNDEKYISWWSANPEIEGRVESYRIDYNKQPVFLNYLRAWQKRVPVHLYTLSGDNKKNWEDHLFSNTELSKLPVAVRKGMREEGTIFTTSTISDYGLMMVGSFAPLSAENIDIIQRFGRVFQQSYTRYLDVQKAEAQAREAQIELGLERVRARAMAMQNSEELKGLIGTVFTELTKLDLALTRCLIMIFDPTTNASTWWMANSEAPSNPTGLSVQYHEHSPYLAYIKGWQEQQLKWTYLLKGKIKKQWDNFLFTETGLSNLPDFVIAGMKAPDQVYLNASFNSFGNLTLATLEPLSDAHFDIMLRFAKVFDLTYTRFNDLKNAEAQAREAKIEVALERVRAKTMAMHNSNDVSAATAVMFNELSKLGVENMRCGVAILHENSDVMEVWAAFVTTDGHEMKGMGQVGMNGHALWQEMYRDWKGKKESYLYHLQGEDKKAYYRALLGEQRYNAAYITEDQPDHYCYVTYFSDGAIFTFNPTLHNEEQKQILKRFASVFSHTYRRYLDLRKAEAQAKESQIQLALERVRARTMAMQGSEELREVASLMFQQIQSLGIPSWSCGYNIFQKDDRIATSWMSNHGQMQPAFQIPLSGLSTFIRFKTSKENGEEFWVEELAGRELKTHYDFLLSLPGLEGVSEQNKQNALALPSYQINYVVNFSEGNLLFITYEKVPEAQDIFKRFGKTFEQTYTRFLDLQKAEAQARESQMQLALERVRARTMAMHKSEELADLSLELVKQVQALGVETWFCAFNIYDDGTQDSLEWGSNGQGTFEKYRTPREGVFLRYYEAGRRGEKLLINAIGEDECPAHYEYLCSLPGIGDQLLKMKAAGIPFPTSQIDHVAYFKYGYLLFISYEPVPESHEIFKRFANVFEQTYTRFLDLKRAEAQSRESQIQLALERVRARTMAMQTSEELAEAAALLFEQVRSLGIETYASGFTIWENDDNDLVSWMCNADGSVNPPFRMPARDIQWHREQYESWKKKEDYIIHNFAGVEMQGHYRYLRSFPFLDEAFKKSEAAGVGTPERQVHNAFNFSHGNLLFITLQPVPEDYEIFRRFAKVFEQTYTRFLDLQKAEAQTREAKIEAALEKVRSRTLAMQKSDELAETSAVLFKQLIALGISPNRLYISIMKDDEGEAEFWITDEEGNKVSMAYEDNLNNNPSFKKMFYGWKQQKKSLVIDMKGEELKGYLNYLKTIHVPFKGGLEQRRRLQYIAYFSKGFIGMASPDQQSPETLQLLERFAYVFNLTYTRFNDLQVAEAHALQAEQDLLQIKAARKKAEEALAELQTTQRQLVQSEKMASLGELTAGIAHEIQNPLNFVNNFSEVSDELLDEMITELNNGDADEAMAIATDVKQNLEKIAHHGKRADAIVKGMLQHSRASSGQKELTDINTLCDEYLRLSYHGLRAKDKSFNAKFETDFDESIGQLNVVPQEIGRVVLNLINNAFYAVNQKRKDAESGYQPTVFLQTKRLNDKIEICVKDNGSGIPQSIVEKIFQPFFTTKPTGEGTGLGLSLSYEIVTKGHGGEMKVETEEGKGSVFIVQLPY